MVAFNSSQGYVMFDNLRTLTENNKIIENLILVIEIFHWYENKNYEMINLHIVKSKHALLKYCYVQIVNDEFVHRKVKTFLL